MKDKAYAKINLTLNVLNKREDGYHNLKSVMLPINFYDEIEITESDEYFINSTIENNIVTNVFNIFKERYNIGNVSISISKNIPMQAGLAGGSADATTTIKMLNDLFELDLSLKELESIALEVGSDTLFTLHSKPAIISSRGDVIDFLDIKPNFFILLIKPNVGISTKDAFSNISEFNVLHNDDIISALACNDVDKINDLCYNSFLDSILCNTDFKKMYIKLSSYNKTHLSGSGSTMFMISSDENELLEIKEKIKDCFVEIVRPLTE